MQVEKGTAAHPGEQSQTHERRQRLVRLFVQCLQQILNLLMGKILRDLVVNGGHGDAESAGNEVDISFLQGEIQYAFDQSQNVLDGLRRLARFFQFGAELVYIVDGQFGNAFRSQRRSDMKVEADTVILDGTIGAFGFLEQTPQSVETVS